MDKQRTENAASDNTDQIIKDVRSITISSEDPGRPLTEQELREKQLNEEHQEANKRSQKNAGREAKYGDASDAQKSRFLKDQHSEDTHVPLG